VKCWISCYRIDFVGGEKKGRGGGKSRILISSSQLPKKKGKEHVPQAIGDTLVIEDNQRKKKKRGGKFRRVWCEHSA